MKKMKRNTRFLFVAIIFLFSFFMLTIRVEAAENGYAMFPMKYMNISNGESGHGGRLIIDICGYDTGKDAFYAPFDGKVVRVNFGSSSNNVIIESTNPIKWANGTTDYVHMWLAHDDDISDLYVGKTFKQGEEIYREGTTGISTGNHVHMICGQGHYPTSGGLTETTSGWTLTNQVSPYKVLFLYSDTVAKNTGGYSWITLSGSTSNFEESSSTDGNRVQNTGVSDITDTTARINARVSPAGNATELGFYLGTSPYNMQKTVENASQAGCNSIWYDLGTGKWCSSLQKCTTYYYQIYAVIGGVTYKSSIDSFTTTGDGQAPVISNVNITDVTRDGYTVTCQVTDNVGVTKVCFPTWTEANGQDDISSNWGESTAIYSPISGNTYSYRVNVADHNYESGAYITHIYAYDAGGNFSCFGTGTTVNRDILLESFTLSNNVLSLDINQTHQLTVQAYSPSNTTADKTAAWASSDTSVASVDGQGNVTGLKKGTATITCTVAGKTQTCNVTVSNVVLEEFGGWVESLPGEITNNTSLYEVQQKTQYRSSTKSETVSQNPNLSGWTKSNEWWGEWQSCGSDVSATDTREVKQEQQYVITQYLYNHWHNYSTGNTSPVQYSGWTYEETGWLDYQLTVAGTSIAGGTKYSAGSNKLGPCGYTAYWYNESKRDVYNTLYYYRDKYFQYYQWSAWSNWSDDAVSASETVNVETRTLYRYRYIGPSITIQPSNQVVEENETANFSVKANGRNLKYQWQESMDGEQTWSDSTMSGNTTELMQVCGTEERNNCLFRCVITDENGNSITTNTVKLTVQILLQIITQPVSQRVESGKTAAFSVKAKGNNLSYQWQTSKDAGKTWNDSSEASAKTADLVVEETAEKYGYLFRCIIKDGDGNIAISETVKLTAFEKLMITKQPENQSTESGNTVEFTVSASGTALTYQWQLCYAGENTFRKCTFQGADTSTLTVDATKARNGYKFRCVVTNEQGENLTSDAAVLTVSTRDLGVSLVASQSTADPGDKVTFTAQGNGGDGNYQYKFIINDTANDKWYKLQDFRSNNTIEWTATTAGTKRIMVDIRDGSGKSVGKNVSVVVNGIPELSAKFTASAYEVNSGDTVTLTAAAMGGSGKYNYKFIINDKTDDMWYRLQDFGTNNVINWTATTPGIKRLMVDVVDSQGRKYGTNITITVK